MNKQILFIQGAGEGAYAADKKLADSLKRSLGTAYTVQYPAMPHEDEPDYAAWKHQIEEELAKTKGPVILVGHSLGGSMLIKYLSEVEIKNQIAGIFLIAIPFWGGDGWLYEGYEELELADGFAARLPRSVPIFLYQGRNDEIVPFDHLALYAKALSQATVRELDDRNHQLNDNLTDVANDIKQL